MQGFLSYHKILQPYLADKIPKLNQIKHRRVFEARLISSVKLSPHFFRFKYPFFKKILLLFNPKYFISPNQLIVCLF